MARIGQSHNRRYRLEVDSLACAEFDEVVVGRATIDAVRHRDPSDPPELKKLSGAVKYGNITLKRGVCARQDARDLYAWHADVAAAGVAAKRRKVVIVVHDDGGDVARFVVSQAWPVKYEGPVLKGDGNDVRIECLELANEGFERDERDESP